MSMLHGRECAGRYADEKLAQGDGTEESANTPIQHTFCSPRSIWRSGTMRLQKCGAVLAEYHWLGADVKTFGRPVWAHDVVG